MKLNLKEALAETGVFFKKTKVCLEIDFTKNLLKLTQIRQTCTNPISFYKCGGFYPFKTH